MMSTEISESREAGGPALPHFMEMPLTDFGLMAAFHARSPYEQDVFLEWITSADVMEVRDDRIAEMLDDLALRGWRADDDPQPVDFASPRSTHNQEV